MKGMIGQSSRPWQCVERGAGDGQKLAANISPHSQRCQDEFDSTLVVGLCAKQGESRADGKRQYTPE
jgi:hypothetical protein